MTGRLSKGSYPGLKPRQRPDQRHMPTEHGQKLAEEFKCSFVDTSVTIAFESTCRFQAAIVSAASSCSSKKASRKNSIHQTPATSPPLVKSQGQNESASPSFLLDRPQVHHSKEGSEEIMPISLVLTIDTTRPCRYRHTVQAGLLPNERRRTAPVQSYSILERREFHSAVMAEEVDEQVLEDASRQSAHIQGYLREDKMLYHKVQL